MPDDDDPCLIGTNQCGETNTGRDDPECSPGQILNDAGQCVDDTRDCDEGMHEAEDGTCVIDVKECDPEEMDEEGQCPTCPEGMFPVGDGECSSGSPQCPEGQSYTDGACHCPEGQNLIDGECRPDSTDPDDDSEDDGGGDDAATPTDGSSGNGAGPQYADCNFPVTEGSVATWDYVPAAKDLENQVFEITGTFFEPISVPAQNLLDYLAQWSAVTYVPMSGNRSADFHQDLLVSKAWLNTGIRELGYSIEGVSPFERADIDIDKGLPNNSKAGTGDDYFHVMCLRLDTKIYVFDKHHLNMSIPNPEYGFDTYRYRGWFAATWMSGLSFKDQCREWFDTKVALPGNIRRLNAFMNASDIAFTIILPAYGGVSQIANHGRWVEGTAEAIASVAMFGMGTALQQGAKGMRMAFAWTAAAASGLQAGAVIWARPPSQQATTWDLIGPAATGAIAVPFGLKIEWVRGAWQAVKFVAREGVVQVKRVEAGIYRASGKLASNYMTQELAQGLLAKADRIVYNTGLLRGEWAKDMPAIMEQVMLHRAGKAIGAIDDIEMEGIKHSYEAVLNTIRKSNGQLSMRNFKPLMDIHLEANRIWSSANRGIMASKGSRVNMQGHQAIGSMIADLGFTPEKILSGEAARTVMDPGWMKKAAQQLENAGWTVGWTDYERAATRTDLEQAFSRLATSAGLTADETAMAARHIDDVVQELPAVARLQTDPHAWMEYMTAVRGIVIGAKPAPFPVYRLVGLWIPDHLKNLPKTDPAYLAWLMDPATKPTVYAGALATGRRIEDVLPFAAQFADWSADASKLQFAIVRVPPNTIPVTRGTGRGALMFHVENEHGMGVVNEFIAIAGSNHDLQKAAQLCPAATVPGKAGQEVVTVNAFPIFDYIVK